MRSIRDLVVLAEQTCKNGMVQYMVCKAFNERHNFNNITQHFEGECLNLEANVDRTELLNAKKTITGVYKFIRKHETF